MGETTTRRPATWTLGGKPASARTALGALFGPVRESAPGVFTATLKPPRPPATVVSLSRRRPARSAARTRRPAGSRRAGRSPTRSSTSDDGEPCHPAAAEMAAYGWATIVVGSEAEPESDGAWFARHPNARERVRELLPADDCSTPEGRVAIAVVVRRMDGELIREVIAVPTRDVA